MDLAQRAYSRNIVCFSDFLGLGELNIYHGMQRDLAFIKTISRGGHAYAERQMIAFIPDAFCYSMEDAEVEFPYTYMEIAPANPRFSDALTHRDYLGAILNLGIDRGLIGDILVGEGSACVICAGSIAPFIGESLTRVRHTTVVCRELAGGVPEGLVPKLTEVSGSVASARLDALTALAFRIPRPQAVSLIEGGRVFADGRLVTDPSCRPKEGSIISCRGLGRFRFDGTGKVTKKGRVFAQLSLYSDRN